MERQGIYVLNGRAHSNAPDSYTFIEHNGNRIIDLVWVDLVTLDHVSKFEIISTTEPAEQCICLLS